MTVPDPADRVLSSPPVKIAGYLVAATLAFVLLSVLWPGLTEVPAGTEGASRFGDLVRDAGRPAVGTMPPAEAAGRAFLALTIALVFAVPITWMYASTTRRMGYDTSFVRMMIGLPVVVAGVVQIVRGDLALAFALAGIVAAVRFRTTVRDLQNAVNAFAVIAIGLAAGIGSWALAGVISAVFTAVSYALWKLRIGSVEPGIERALEGQSLAETLVPGEPHRAVAIGSQRVIERLDIGEEETERATERLADYVRADALRKKKKYNTLLLAYSEHPDRAIEQIEPVLDQHALRWVHVDLIGPSGRNGATPPSEEAPRYCAIEFLLRLKDEVDVGTMVDQIQEKHCVRAVEMKPIKGLRKRLT